MKISNILTGIFLFIGTIIYAQSPKQDTLLQYYYKYPRQAIQDADQMYQQAIRENNNSLLIKSLILKTTFSIRINRDEYPELLKKLETYIIRETDVNTKSILHSYTGQLYIDYFNQNRYVIQQRTSLSGEVPQNINEWSANLFKEKIFHHLLASVANQKKLQATPIKNYNPILIQGAASDSLRPTLYDFLCQRAIYNFTTSLAALPQQLPESIPNLLAPAEIFVKTPITVIPLNITTNVLKLWQDLLNFRLEAQKPAALVMADLERLKYTYNISQSLTKDSLYLTTLSYMKQQYIQNPIAVEIMATEASQLLRHPYEVMPLKTNIISNNTKLNKQKALDICKEGIRLYPHYNRIDLLYKLINDIQAPEISTEFPGSIYPGEKLPIKISSQNLNSIVIELYRINMGTVDYFNSKNQKGAKIPQTRISQQSYPLQADLVKKDTTISITIPQAGLYKVILKSNKTKKTISNELICTQLFATHQSTPQLKQFQVFDWQSGKPIQNAKVLIYKQQYPNYIILDSIYTNQQGLATLKKGINLSNYYYQVVNSGNPNGYLQSVYQSRPYKFSNLSTAIITDRKIYRPGQTILFKGITWFANTDTLYTLNNTKFNIIFKNPNYKQISCLKITTDPFGSFTGSFIIPSETLNGNYTLSTPEGQTHVIVADFKRPEFEVSFKTPEQTFYLGDSICLPGTVKSFSGMNLPDNTVKYEIASSSLYGWRRQVDNSIQGIAITDANGNFKIKFKANPKHSNPQMNQIYFYKITAKVTDPKGETQEGSIGIPVYSGKAQPIITIPQQINKNIPTAFRITLKDFPPRATAQTIYYSITKLKDPSKIIIDQEIQDTIPEHLILEGQLQMSRQDSILPDLSNQASGAYLFTVKNGTCKEKQIFYLYSPQDKKPPVPTYNWLVKEKTRCHPGETAHIQFGTSVKNAYISYDIYSASKLLKRKVTTLSNEILNIDIPYLAEYGNRIWLSIYYVKDKNYIQEVIPIEKIITNRTLAIQTTVFRDKLQPGEREEWKVRILNSQGKPAIAEALAMMYDASLDQIAPYNVAFHPNYIYQGFQYYWTKANNSINQNQLSPWDFSNKNYKIPGFQFDHLNTFNKIYSDYGKYEVEECGEAAEPIVVGFSQSTRRYANAMVTGAAPKTKETAADRDISGTPVTEFRENFQETAFFYPQLKPDSTGNIDIKFTVPESLTKWKFILLAYTKELAYGKLERFITTSKPLMVRPNLPRFLRDGDQAELKATISNLSDSLQSGSARLELLSPDSKQTIISRKVDFQIAGGQSQTVNFQFRVPGNINLTICRISAHTTNFSDGEQNLLPILPNETLVTETLPIFTTQAGTHTFSMKNNSTTRRDYRLTLELAANPIWYGVLAIPTLTEAANENVTDLSAAYYVNTIASRIVQANPKITETIRNWNSTKNNPTLLSKLEQNSELKSILLEASPWMLQAQNETERMQTLSNLFDQNRLSYLQNQALEKLSGLQTPEGGWSWFKGMYPSRFMTTNVLTILARAASTGQQEYGGNEKNMQIKALRYLDREIQKDFNFKPKHISYDQILYLYTRSLYRDIPLGDALEAHKYFMTLAQKQWSNFSLYEKAILTVALKNYGFRAEAQNILKSLRQYAIIQPDQGMYWPSNQNSYYRNSAVQVHTAIMEAFQAVEGNTVELNLMKLWLLRQKQVQSWANVPATVDAIYALLLTGNDLLSEQDPLQIQLGQYQISAPSENNPLGYLKKSFSSTEIQPNMQTVVLTKKNDSPSWGGLYLQYFEKLDQIKEQKTDISITKKLYISQKNKDGKDLLVPLTAQSLKTGDKVTIRLTLSLKRDMEFLQLKDLRAACFEPVEQLSGNHWKFGTVYYQDIKDASTNFFFSSLSRGTYVIEYSVWANQAGEYQDGIATLQSVYAPEFNSFSNAGKIKITD